MKRLVIGIIAHVDSGKTTLSEAFLYNSGAIQKLGRVDRRDAFFDTDTIERDRGITIFSKQAELKFGNTEITLLDTPGHVDFTAETERTLRVLDYAILVVSGTEGVQSHTETLWKLLEHYGVPAFIFVNKTDLQAFDKEAVLSQLRQRLSEGCLDFEKRDDTFFENAAMADEALLEEYTLTDSISDDSLRTAVLSRKLFPCSFGSALKNEGVCEFMEFFDYFTCEKSYPDTLGGRIYKISEDEKGNRLTFLKITGGVLRSKNVLDINGRNEKVNEIRIYSGNKFISVPEASAGHICAVTGLASALPGDGIGSEKTDNVLVSEPVFTYAVRLEEGTDINYALTIFRKLEQEETQMHVTFNEHLQKINVQIMGEIQLEVLKRVLSDRFELEVEFEHGSIIYKETICDTFEGVGHYEPLRHYSEVHLVLSPGERGSGLVFSSECSENELNRNWQRLVMTHLAEKAHLGVLIGAPITDIKITLVSGCAHNKHTEGGDFRQATYRAVRQGLMQALKSNKCQLLEPWYSFTLELPLESVGRAMTDLSQMSAKYEMGESRGETTVITGTAPVTSLRDYNKQVISYTHGKGKFSFNYDGYAECMNSDEIISEKNYDPESDIMNTADSVFCANGGGFLVKWNDVLNYMHLPLLKDKKEEVYEPVTVVRKKNYESMIADEEELMRIFEATYGKIKRRTPDRLHTPKEKKPVSSNKKARSVPDGPVYLLIDGYNIIFAWDDLKAIAEKNIDLARTLLISRVCNYQSMRKCNVIIVFDAYKVKGGQCKVEKVHGISVIYTKEAETADQYIEKTAMELSKNYRVKVATSDGLIQIIIFGNGAVRVTPRELRDDIDLAEKEMREFISQNNDNSKTTLSQINAIKSGED